MDDFDVVDLNGAGEAFESLHDSKELNLDDSQFEDVQNDDSQNGDFAESQFEDNQLAPTQEDLELFLSLPDYSALTKHDVSNNNNNSNSTNTPNRKRGWKKSKNNNNDSNSTPKTKYASRPCPDFKKIPGTSFLVDGFKYKSKDCTHYFLRYCMQGVYV